MVDGGDMRSADIVSAAPRCPLYLPRSATVGKRLLLPQFRTVGPDSLGAAPPPSVVAADRHRHIEAERDPWRGHHIGQTPRRQQPALAHQPGMGEAGGYLLATGLVLLRCA